MCIRSFIAIEMYDQQKTLR